VGDDLPTIEVDNGKDELVEDIDPAIVGGPETQQQRPRAGTIIVLRTCSILEGRLPMDRWQTSHWPSRVERETGRRVERYVLLEIVGRFPFVLSQPSQTHLSADWAQGKTLR
jgi:hypothetical protein